MSSRDVGPAITWSYFDELCEARQLVLSYDEAQEIKEQYARNLTAAIRGEYTEEDAFDALVLGRIRASPVLRELAERISPLLFAEGSFVKMHLSPKDAMWFGGSEGEPEWGQWARALAYMKCSSAEDVIVRFVKSQRIVDTIEDRYAGKLDLLRVFIKPWDPPRPEQEWRLFMWRDRMEARPMFPAHPDLVLLPPGWEEKISEWPRAAEQYCIDVAIDGDGEFRVLEFNPLDDSTDLYEY